MFIWKGQKSDEWNIVCEEMPPISLPAEKVEEIEIEGKSGFYTINTGTYEGTTKEVIAHYEGNNFDDLAEWLSGSGDLILDTLPDRYYKAYIQNAIPLDIILEAGLSKFPIKFRCQPFGYSLKNDLITITEKGTIVTNTYTQFSEPVITVYGTGNIELFIGKEQISLKNVNEFFVIDTPLKEAYKNNDKLGESMIGEFPTLKAGADHAITWDGTVTKIEINPNWRYKL